METVKITIPGEFYDSQIYSGRLYLWTIDSHILVIDWERLIEDITPSADLRIASHCAFINSEYLSGEAWRVFSEDQNIRDIITSKLGILGSTHLSVNTLKKYISSFRV